MIRKILLGLFSDPFVREWKRRNKHNFTLPVKHFKIDAVKVGKGTYGKLNVVSRDYQSVKTCNRQLLLNSGWCEVPVIRKSSI